MEKISNDFINLSQLPTEIQQEIAAYLDGPVLTFFAQSNKQILKNILPLLVKCQTALPALKIMVGLSSTYCVLGDKLFVKGSNSSGKLGLGHTQKCSVFTAVPLPGKLKQIAVSDTATFIITDDDQLWACGHNGRGQLGLGHTDPCLTFTAVPLPSKPKQIVTTNSNSFVITEEGQLLACGDNNSGELGLGHRNYCHTFTPVPLPAKVKQVTGYGPNTFILTEDDQLLACGYNSCGQLGIGDSNKILHTYDFAVVPFTGKPKQVIAGGLHSFIITEDDQLWGCGNNTSGELALEHRSYFRTFIPIPLPRKFKQVVVSRDHTFIVTEDDQLWGCGYNGNHQLGLEPKVCGTLKPTSLSGKVKEVATGPNHTIVVTEDDQLWACGLNYKDELLGVGQKEDCETFTLVKTLPEPVRQTRALRQILEQLIKMGRLLTQTPDTKNSKTFHTQHQLDEPEGQPPLKKMRL